MDAVVEHEALQQAMGLPAWVEVMPDKAPGMFYHGQWVQTGAEPPIIPHGKGWVAHKDSNCGIAAVWVNMSIPVGIVNTVNMDGDKCHTPHENGVKNGVEKVWNLGASEPFEQTYTDGVLPNGKPF